jgi:peptide/nickel transport system permease protein
MHKSKVIATFLIACLAAGVIFGPKYIETAEGGLLLPPNAQYWFGTDFLGRSVMARTLEGLATSFVNAFVVLFWAVVIGALMAVLSVLQLDKKIDRIIVLAVEAIRAFPTIVLVLLFAAAGISNTVLLAFFFWTAIWRLLRNLLAIQQNQPYALNAQLFGMFRSQVLFLEVLPNVWPSVRNYLPALLAEILSVQTALEFLGFGVALDEVSLGRLLAEAMSLGFSAPWVWMPSLIVLIVLVCSLIWINLIFSENQKWIALG